MSKTKSQYTKEQVEELEKVYQPKASEEERIKQVDSLVISLDKKKASIVQKLVTMQLYVKLEDVKKEAVHKVTKVEKVEQFIDLFNRATGASLKMDEVKTLTNASVSTIDNLLMAVQPVIDVELEKEAA